MRDHRERKDDPLDVQYGPSHPISISAGGVLHRLSGMREARVNSLHAQGIQRLGDGLEVEAVAPDGLIEAISVNACEGASRSRCNGIPSGNTRTTRCRPRSSAPSATHAAEPTTPARRNATMQHIDEFLKKHHITEIEAIIPDMAGIARGKIIPRSKFESGESHAPAAGRDDPDRHRRISRRRHASPASPIPTWSACPTRRRSAWCRGPPIRPRR